MEIKKVEFGEDYLKRFKIGKPAKNENRQRLISRLMEVLGRTFWQVNGPTKDFPESWLEDVIKECQHYSNIKLRNLKFNEFIQKTKQ